MNREWKVQLKNREGIPTKLYVQAITERGAKKQAEYIANETDELPGNDWIAVCGRIL